MLDDQKNISGSQDGTIALWNVIKKPIFRHKMLTQLKSPLVNTRGKKSLVTTSISSDSSLPYWINCLAMFPSSDLFASVQMMGI